MDSKPRTFISRITFFWGACLLLSVSAFAIASERPNIILIVADDLGYADMSFKEEAPSDVKTPAIDALARSGVFLENAYATTPVCSPARAGLITGRYQQRWGNFWYSQGGLPYFEATLPELLRDLGYATKKIGKTHLNGGQKEHPLDHGFDEFFGFIHHTWDYVRLSEKDAQAYDKKRAGSSGKATIGPLVRARDEKVSVEGGFTTELFTDDAIEYIERDWSGQPFYLQLAYNAVHMPTYVTDSRYAEKVGLEHLPWNRDADKWSFPYWDPSEEEWYKWHRRWGHMGKVDAEGRKRYISHLIAMDDGIGRLMSALHAKGLGENTIVVFLSDNGGTVNTYANNAPLNGYKFMFAEGGLRIPIIVSWPRRIVAAERRDQLVSAMDLFPTLIEYAGGVVPSNVDGRSLRRVFEDENVRSERDALCWSDGFALDPEVEGDGFWAVRKGAWKLVQSKGWVHEWFSIEEGLAHPSGDYVFPEGLLLFNLEEDEGETDDLASKYPEKVTELKRIYDSWSKTLIPPVKGDDRMTIRREMLKNEDS